MHKALHTAGAGEGIFGIVMINNHPTCFFPVCIFNMNDTREEKPGSVHNIGRHFDRSGFQSALSY